MVDMKTFWGLAMPNQSCLDVTKYILSWFWSDILGLEIPNLHDPYIQYYCTLDTDWTKEPKLSTK